MQDCFFSVEMIYCIFFHLSKQQNEISLSSGSGRDKILKNDWSGHSVFICYFLVVSSPGNWSCCLRLCFWSPQGHCRLCPAGLGCGREVGCCQSLPGTAPSPDLCCAVCADLSEFLHMRGCRQLYTARLIDIETFPFQHGGVFHFPALRHQLEKALTWFPLGAL